MNNSVVQVFGNDFLNSFGFQLPRIIEHVPTEILTISGEKHIIEDLFRLDNDTLLHVEYQSSASSDDLDQLLVDLMWYDLKIYERHEKDIQTIIVFGSQINEAKISVDLGAIKYEVAGAVWLGRWNGDQIAEEFTQKVEQKGELTDEELSTLVMIPTMHNTGSRLEMTMKAVQIANKLDDSGKRDLVLSLMRAIAERLLTNDDFVKVAQAFERI